MMMMMVEILVPEGDLKTKKSTLDINNCSNCSHFHSVTTPKVITVKLCLLAMPPLNFLIATH